MTLTGPHSINDRGEPGTLERLLWLIVRAKSHNDWKVVNDLAHSLLGIAEHDTGASIIVNAFAALTHEVVYCKGSIARLARDCDCDIERS